MYFKTWHPVNNFHSFIQQFVSPEYVCFLVKTSLKLNHSCDTFTISNSIKQSINHT
jgi:hypothetical protein